MKDDLFKALNKQQKEAVKNVDGPSVILAGAGSGKTRALVSKVINLIENHNIPSKNILMITFTNKAANEMKERIYRILSDTNVKLGFIGTFHSFCCYVLRRESAHLGLERNFVIYDDDDQASVIKKILKKIEVTKFSIGYFANRISVAKNQLISPERYLEIFSDFNAAAVAKVYSMYQSELRKNNALDFDDLITEVVLLFLRKENILHKYQSVFKYILIDEFQDTNHSQYLLSKLLAEKNHNITVVGDFSQSIYSWRGADVKNLDKFKDDFPTAKIFYLEENYRSTQNILNFAYNVISKNETHPILSLFTTKKNGEEVVIQDTENEEQEAIYIAEEIKRLVIDSDYSSFSVLYRTNAQSRAIEEVFLHYGIPYILIGGTRFYERKEIKDVISYLRLLINPKDEISEERIIKIGKRKWQAYKQIQNELQKLVDEKTTSELMEEVFSRTGYLNQYDIDNEEDYARLENIRELKSVAMSFNKVTEFLEQVALVESEYSDGEKKNKNKDGVRLMTLHQAKGLEFPYVFISGVEEGILPHSRSVDDYFQLEEERRLFYVGITRAKEKLYITYARCRFVFGRRSEGVKSRFITDENDVVDTW